MERWISGLGLLVLLGVCWGACPAGLRKFIPWRLVGAGVLLQIGFAFLILKTPLRGLFAAANDGVNRLLDFTRQGATFIFGDLVMRTDTFGYIFAVQVLPSIVFISALVSILYYLGWMQWVVRWLGGSLSWLLGTSPTESVAAAANIFLGQVEAPLVVKPYLPTMTQSELLATMVPGMASIAGGVLVAYVGLLSPFFPDIAGHLLAASLMSAPAALVCSKLILPESETAPNPSSEIVFEKLDHSFLEAISRGTQEGVSIAVSVGATLMVYIALIALANGIFGWVGGLLGFTWTLQGLLGLIFAPLAWLLGVSNTDVLAVGSLLGQKLVLNEFVAYTTLAQTLKDGGLSARSVTIVSYALCGFANFSSIGIQLAGIGSLAPTRRGDLSRLGWRALLAGSVACFMTAAIVGILL